MQVILNLSRESIAMSDNCVDEIVYSRKIPIKKTYDVIVCGGGVAGVAAAVSAAKEGCSTLLLEKSNILGGLGTLGLRLTSNRFSGKIVISK